MSGGLESRSTVLDSCAMVVRIGARRGGLAVTVAAHSYNGSGNSGGLVRTDIRGAEPDVMTLAYAIGAPGSYGNLDRSGRVVTSQWTKDLATDHNFFDVDVFYDRASNITWVDDTVLGGWGDRHRGVVVLVKGLN